MKYLDKYKIYENDNSLVTIKKDLKILENICLKLNERVKKIFLEEDIWENFVFKYNGPYIRGGDSDYHFDEMDIDEMAKYMKQYNFPLYESLLGFGLEVELKAEYVEKYVDINHLTSRSINYIINNSKDFSTETYINSLKFEILLMEEGLKVQKKLQSKGFIVEDLETHNEGIWMSISYDSRKYFDKNRKMFKNINEVFEGK